MSNRQPVVEKKLSPAVVTEAAAWVARLHGPYRSSAAERGLRHWLEEHPDHPRAFELVTESWDEVSSLKSGARIGITLPGDAPAPIATSRRFAPLAMAASVLLLVTAAAIYYFSVPSVGTGVGEQRTLALDDGSRVYLNTATRVEVDYRSERRHIVLAAGEALFEVAPDAQRPFVVSTGNQEVTALGTAFLIRRDAQRVAVTLMEGKVAVVPVMAPADAKREKVMATVLQPGERVVFSNDRQMPTLDRPVVSKLTAWQRGKVPIDNLPLAEAIAEMNRYSVVELSLQTPRMANLRVSGIFRAGDSLSFARAVAQNYGLKIKEGHRRIVLAGDPVSP